MTRQYYRREQKIVSELLRINEAIEVLFTLRKKKLRELARVLSREKEDGELEAVTAEVNPACLN